jgi:hypothetical protein
MVYYYNIKTTNKVTIESDHGHNPQYKERRLITTGIKKWKTSIRKQQQNERSNLDRQGKITENTNKGNSKQNEKEQP